jgi:N-acetylmuramic acid 6-phosphate etherase
VNDAARDAGERLVTESANPRTADLDRLGGAELAALVFAEDRAVPEACAAAAADVGRLIDAAAEALAVGGRLVYAGAGTSGRLALLDAVELGPTFDFDVDRVPVLLAGGDDAVFRSREGAEDREMDGGRAVDRVSVGPLDVVVGITASGRTPFTLGALRTARRRGARTGAIVCNAVSDDFPAEIVVHLDTGPEVLAGSTRMKAGSATKMALNALSLGVMARIGKVHGNRMVDVRVTSEKLRRRAEGLVVQLGGVDADEAAGLLDDAGGSAKLAILMACSGLDAPAARGRLEAAGGVLSRALEDA